MEISKRNFFILSFRYIKYLNEVQLLYLEEEEENKQHSESVKDALTTAEGQVLMLYEFARILKTEDKDLIFLSHCLGLIENTIQKIVITTEETSALTTLVLFYLAQACKELQQTPDEDNKETE